MRLKVVLRPALDGVTVSLENCVIGQYADILVKLDGNRFQRAFCAEITALVKYLRELLHIAEPPAISMD